MSYLTIALDVMGGDYGPHVTIPAAINILTKYDNIFIYLVGTESEIIPFLKKIPDDLNQRYQIIATTEVVPMDLAPSLSLRNYKDASMRVALIMLFNDWGSRDRKYPITAGLAVTEMSSSFQYWPNSAIPSAYQSGPVPKNVK